MRPHINLYLFSVNRPFVGYNEIRGKVFDLFESRFYGQFRLEVKTVNGSGVFSYFVRSVCRPSRKTQRAKGNNRWYPKAKSLWHLTFSLLVDSGWREV
jgi:hypothetical protein